MKKIIPATILGLFLPAAFTAAQPAATSSARQARDATYEAYLSKLERDGGPKVVQYEALREALRGYQVVVLGGYSGLDYEHPTVLRQQIEAVVKRKGDRAAYVIGATEDGIGRAYGWIPEVASELALGDVKTAGIVSRNAAEWGVARQDLVVFVDTDVDSWEVKVDGRSLMVSIAEETDGEMIYFRGGAVAKAEINEALERGVPVTIYTGEGLAPNAANLAKRKARKPDYVADGTTEFVERTIPGLKVFTVDRPAAADRSGARSP